MPDYQGATWATPFGRNNFLRSTKLFKPESYTFCKEAIPAVTIDGYTGQKVLQPGTVLASITSGEHAGKVGVFQGAATREVQTLTKTGTWSAGYYAVTVTLDGVAYEAVDIAYNATAAQISAALVVAGVPSGVVVVTGGPLSSTAVVLTYHATFGGDIAAASVDITNANGEEAGVTGSTPGIGVVETTAGVAGAADGRGDTANIVGLCNTFLPWQLIERDCEVAALYICTAVQAWCFEYNAAGTRIALTNTTADAMRGTKGLDITFK
jgi:hypothetical protein